MNPNKKSSSTIMPSRRTRRSAWPSRHLRVCRCRGLSACSAVSHCTESLIWKACLTRAAAVTAEWKRERHGRATHHEALRAIVAHASAGDAHCRDTRDDHEPHHAARCACLPMNALVECSQNRRLCLLKDLQQFLHLSIVGLVLPPACSDNLRRHMTSALRQRQGRTLSSSSCFLAVALI